LTEIRKAPLGRVRAAARVVVASGLGALALLAYGLWVQPYAAGQEGSTACLPFIGPVVRLNPGLADSTRIATAVHENTHAEQCRRYGFFGQLLRTQRTLGRLGIEAEAYCAESRWRWGRGGDPRRLFLFAVDALVYDTRGIDQLAPGIARDTFAARCPDLARAAGSARGRSS
jgi:hypothetical protein